MNQPAATSDLWKSLTTGKEYRVRITNDQLTADWVNIPPVAAERGAYIHTFCRRTGAKWIGTSKIFMPCTVGKGRSEHIANTCHLVLKLEVDSLTRDRISGRGQSLEKFDCHTCKVIKAGWGNFVWVSAH